MSAREPVGMSNRSGLFDPEGVSSSARQQENEDFNENNNNIQEIFGTPRAEDDPLQLEHTIGYSGSYRQTLHSVPYDGNLFVKSMGNLVSIDNLTDSLDQKCLRGHDMRISALAVSPSGYLLASGQCGTNSFKGNAAPIFVWKTDTKKRLVVLRGLTNRVNCIAFSTDERFLWAAGEDCAMYIWDLASGEVVYAQRTPSVVNVMMWVEHRQESRRVSYELVFGYGNNLYSGDFLFDIGRVQWGLNVKAYGMPPGGMIRNFTNITMSRDKVNLYLGTTGGEMMVFLRGSATVFRVCIPVCTLGLQVIVPLPKSKEGTSLVMCGGGDGSIHVLEGNDMAWKMINKTQLVDCGICSMSMCANQEEVIIGCQNGGIYRCAAFIDPQNKATPLSNHLVEIGHTSTITCISAVHPATGLFVTGTSAGDLKTWDLADYACVCSVRYPKYGAAACVEFLEEAGPVDKNTKVLTGWEDGCIRCLDANNLSTIYWYLTGAHRGGIRCLASRCFESLHYVMSGGADGTVRVWRASNRELVCQHSEHGKKAVSQVLVDKDEANIIHSCGEDGSVVSFNLKTIKRMICHMVTSGSVYNMTQRFDARSEKELITCDSLGRLIHWDIDIREAAHAVQDPSRSALRGISISPSGRFLAFAGDDSFLKIMEVASEQIVSLGQGHSDKVLALTWTPDERQLLTVSTDCCLCIWNFYLGDMAGANDVRK